MKNYIVLSAFFLVLVFSSCGDLAEFNENPNDVSETHPKLLLTQIEWEAFQVEGIDPMFASRMAVQTDGEEEEQWYKWSRGDFEDPYGCLRNVTKMIEEAERVESDVYIALAKFFRAYYFFNLTLTFGDVPYSEALKGESEESYTPAYDTQEDIFTGILAELKEADEILTDDNTIIDGDVIYDGDTEQWRKLINAFRLRVLLTLSEKESDLDFNLASTFASIYADSPLMESNDDNGQIEFVDESGSRYSEFNSSSYSSNRYMDSTFIRRLQDREDPRLFIYAGQTKSAKEEGLEINDFDAYEGGDPVAAYSTVTQKAADGHVSVINSRYYEDPTTEAHMILGYSEQELILAEACVRGWISSSASEHYENAIKASFAFYETYATDYVDYVAEADATEYMKNDLVNFSNASTDEEKIELIIMQEYIPSFLQGGWRVYFEHLRTGYPEFVYSGDNTPPTRWMYPSSEYNYNSDNVAAAIESQFGSTGDDIRAIPWWLK